MRDTLFYLLQNKGLGETKFLRILSTYWYTHIQIDAQSNLS
jgi:hypothetical protein